jgi:hypothetical protein
MNKTASGVSELSGTSATQLPIWIERAKALGPPFVSALAVFVSIVSIIWTSRINIRVAQQQEKNTRERNRLDLYDRRFEIYRATRELIGAVVRHGRASQQEIIQFRTDTLHATFLMDDNMCTYLQKFAEKAELINMLDAELLAISEQSQKQKNLQRQGKLKDWITAQHDRLSREFARFLKVPAE